MGKGTIISHIGNGKYNVEINYNRGKLSAIVDKLIANIASLTTKINTELQAGTTEYNIAKLQRSALEKEKLRLETGFPDDETSSIWCADLTEDLSGVVATVEVPGEPKNIQIAPGHQDGAAHSQAAGQLVPTIGQGSAGWFYNIAVLPGWQKWKPTFRHGVISNIDVDANTCDITLSTAESTQQSLNVNQSSFLNNVAIEYMECNASAFEDGDTVLIEFVGQDWNQPKVIGFKDNPKPCGGDYLVIRCYDTYSTNPEWNFDEYFVYDLDIGGVAVDIPDGSGGTIGFPATPEDIAYWLNITSEKEINESAKYRRYEDLEIRIDTPTDSEDIYCGGEYHHNEVVWDKVDQSDHEYTAVWELFEGECWNSICAKTERTKTEGLFWETNSYGSYGCSVIYLETFTDTWSFTTPTGTEELASFEEYIKIVGTKPDSRFTPITFTTCEYYNTDLGFRYDTRIPPLMRSYYLEKENIYLFSNAISWGISETTKYSDCANSCANPFPPNERVNVGWDQKIQFKMLYNSEGLGTVDPTKAETIEVIQTFLESVYAKYESNGFPLDSGIDPTNRVRQQISIRSQ